MWMTQTCLETFWRMTLMYIYTPIHHKDDAFLPKMLPFCHKPKLGNPGTCSGNVCVLLSKGTAPFMCQHSQQRCVGESVQLGDSFYASALPLTLSQHSRWHVNQILYWLKMRMHANTGVDAYGTPRPERIKGATKAKSECLHFQLTLTRTHKRSPNLTRTNSMSVH